MSIKVTSYVWKHSKHRGTVKMLLLAMSDFANDSGICWPSAATLAERINETERNTRQIIKKLVEDGDLLTIPGGGRGKTTHYAIAVGMSPKQKEKLNSVLSNTVYGNSDKQETVKSGDVNSDIPCQETVKSGDLPDVEFSAPECDEKAQELGGIRHVDPSLDPIQIESHDSLALNAPQEAPPKKRNRDPNQQHPACQVFFEKTGYRPNKQQAANIAAVVNDTAQWAASIAAWTGRGFRINDADGMLDWYQNPDKMTRKNGSNGNGRSHIRQDTRQHWEHAKWTFEGIDGGIVPDGPRNDPPLPGVRKPD